jgi:hypothetical protein
MKKIGGLKKVAPPPDNLKQLLEKEFPEIPYWIGAGMIPKSGKVLIGGEAKIGKTWTVLEMIRALATGTPMFGWDILDVKEPAKVLYIDKEIGERQFKPRIEGSPLAALDDECLERIEYRCRDHEIVLSDPDGRSYLMDMVEASQPDVLILDPIGKCHYYDENDATEIAQLLGYFDELLNTFKGRDMSLVIVHHMNKPPRDRSDFDGLSPYNFRGSSKWFDDPDSILTMRRMPNIGGIDWEAWTMQGRFTFRHEQSLGDFTLAFNRERDKRVVYEGLVDETPPLTPNLDPERRRASEPGPHVRTFVPG